MHSLPGVRHGLHCDPGNSYSRAVPALLAIPDAPPRFIAHRARSASVPLDAARASPSQVQRAHWPGTIRGMIILRSHKRKHPTIMGCFRLWNPATSYSPGRSQAASSPTGRAACSPSQVQCAHWLADYSKTECLPSPKERKPSQCWVFSLLESGNVLLSRAVSSQVPSALKGLTSVFGMGTGGSLSPLSPEC